MSKFKFAPLDETLNIPLYKQLKEQLMEGIRFNVFSADVPLPKEMDIAKSLNISRSVVRQAMLSMVKDGYLYRVPGKGTFITRFSLEYDLLGFYNFKTDMERQGKVLTFKFLSFDKIPADTINAALFHIMEGETLIDVKRVLLVDDYPVILERTTMPEAIVPGITYEDASTSTYMDVFMRNGLKVSRAKRYIEPGIASPYESKSLGMSEGMPVLLIDRYTYSNDPNDRNSVLVRCRWTVRGDRCRYYINLDDRADN